MTDPVELAGFVLSLAMVYCNIREIHWGWPLAILSSALYGVVFWNSQLYGEASLQVMFILGAVWGWRQWRKGMQSTTPDLQSPSHLRISQLSPTERQQTVAATLLAWPVLAFFLNRYTDSDVAVWDALVTALSLLGQYLLAKKKIENWWVWLAVNSFCSLILFSSSMTVGTLPLPSQICPCKISSKAIRTAGKKRFSMRIEKVCWCVLQQISANCKTLNGLGTRPRRPSLLRCATVGCIWPCDRCDSWSLF